MTAFRAAAALLALGSLAALPACSNWNDGRTQSSSAAPATRQELSPGMVRQVQTALQQQGAYKGDVDGVWGPATESAVMSYQQAHNIPPNGQLTPATMASLNLPLADTSGSATAQPAGAQTSSSAAPAAPAPIAPAQPAPAPAPSAANAPAGTTTTTQ
jgi:peptidoglycan hydrolase-like protein with peptidoglycan-binding domain